MNLEQVLRDVGQFVSWLGINPTGQDAIKAIMLVVFALAILMVLGDIYRGEIQHTFHRIRLIGNPARDVTYKNCIQLPKRMISPTLDDVYSNILLYYRYRDHRGRLRTRRLTTYRARFHVRTTFPAAAAPDREADHSYSEDEKILLAKELPDIEIPGRQVSEIVAMARSRVDYVNELWDSRMAHADNIYSKLTRSRWQRFIRGGIKPDQLREPEKVGLVVKFHFPIDPYFLLYKHPESNVRSTAWLTVLTSLFAIFMQLVYAQHDDAAKMRRADLVRYDDSIRTVAARPPTTPAAVKP